MARGHFYPQKHKQGVKAISGPSGNMKVGRGQTRSDIPYQIWHKSVNGMWRVEEIRAKMVAGRKTMPAAEKAHLAFTAVLI